MSVNKNKSKDQLGFHWGLSNLLLTTPRPLDLGEALLQLSVLSGLVSHTRSTAKHLKDSL